MTLDERYVRGVSSLSPMFAGGNPARGPMDSAPNRVQRAFCTSTRSRSSNRFFSRSFTRKPDRNRRRPYPHRWDCAKRVKGAFQRCVQSVSGPSLLRLRLAPSRKTGDRNRFSLISTRREKKVRVLCNSNLNNNFGGRHEYL